MLDRKIIEKIEEKIKQPITTTACGKWLPETIKNETGVLLGETTLKRMFGFTNDPRTPHRSTLDVIAEFLGYKNYDAMAENFFGIMKSELLYNQKFDSPEEFIEALNLKEYMEYYNNKRIKSRLKGKSPVQYRTPSIT